MNSILLTVRLYVPWSAPERAAPGVVTGGPDVANSQQEGGDESGQDQVGLRLSKSSQNRSIYQVGTLHQKFSGSKTNKLLQSKWNTQEMVFNNITNSFRHNCLNTNCLLFWR